MEKIQEIWNEIEEYAESVDGAAEWRLGASEKLIFETQQRMNLTFPKDLIESLKIHDGSDEYDVFFFSGDLLACDKMVECYFVNLTLAEDLREFKKKWEWEETFNLLGNADGRVKPSDRFESRIPVVFQDSDNICVDLDPDVNGKVGQVIWISAQDPTIKLLANSFTEYLELAYREGVERIDSGEY